MAKTGRVEASSHKVQAFECGLLGLEMPSRPDVPPVPSIQALNRVRAAIDFADLDVVVRERDELFPRVFPEPDDRTVLTAPPFGQIVQRGSGSTWVRCRIDRFDIALEHVPVLLRRQPKRVANQVEFTTWRE